MDRILDRTVFSCQNIGMDDIDQFFQSVYWGHLNANGVLRYGQAAFNMLHEKRPDIADKIVGTDADPFYIKSTDDKRWLKFCEFVRDNW